MPKRRRPTILTDPASAAKRAGLRYVGDAQPGITRRRAGRGFTYRDPSGRAVRAPEILRRIRALAIPPAWREVWICPLAQGHLQAVGRDARNRKQYRYHPRWRAVRDETKYNRLLPFAAALPTLRARVDTDLRRPGLPRDKVIATVVRLLETTLIRVGNDEYARDNRSFGLTTLRTHHVDVSGGTLRFRFHGKGGKLHDVDVRDLRVARVVRRCQELPGQELFQYVGEDGELHTLDSADVNGYVREATGEDFTAKDFRTWAGTVLAAFALATIGAGTSVTASRRHVNRAIAAVSRRLGNTPAICRQGYVHPGVIDAYLEGVVLKDAPTAMSGLKPQEAAVAAFLASPVRGTAARAA